MKGKRELGKTYLLTFHVFRVNARPSKAKAHFSLDCFNGFVVVKFDLPSCYCPAREKYVGSFKQKFAMCTCASIVVVGEGFYAQYREKFEQELYSGDKNIAMRLSLRRKLYTIYLWALNYRRVFLSYIRANEESLRCCYTSVCDVRKCSDLFICLSRIGLIFCLFPYISA